MTDWETRMAQKAAERAEATRQLRERVRAREEAERAAKVAAEEAIYAAAKTRVLDLSTIAHCLQVLETELPGPLDWRSVNDDQKQFLGWLAENKAKIRKLSSLQGKASRDYQVLNEFLVEHGFDPKFQPFKGIGVVSILDMLVEWLNITTNQPIFRGDRRYLGFELDADVYQVGYGNPLARLETKTGHSLWIMMADEPTSGFELTMITQDLALAHKTSLARYSRIAMPKLEIDTSADLEWLINAYAQTAEGKSWYVDQAFQMFKLRLNEKGARVKVATGMVARAAAAMGPPPTLVFDRPFIGYFTQPGHDDIAIAAFYAGIDSWKEPAGSLEEL